MAVHFSIWPCQPLKEGWSRTTGTVLRIPQSTIVNQTLDFWKTERAKQINIWPNSQVEVYVSQVTPRHNHIQNIINLKHINNVYTICMHHTGGKVDHNNLSGLTRSTQGLLLKMKSKAGDKTRIEQI